MPLGRPLGSRFLQRDEVSTGTPPLVAGLEADYQRAIERSCDSLESVEVRAMPSALDAGDLGVARADEVGELLLTKPGVHPILDE